MRNALNKLIPLLLLLALLITLTGCAASANLTLSPPETTSDTVVIPSRGTTVRDTTVETTTADPTPSPEPTLPLLPEDGAYTSRDDVALYIHLYGQLPDNFMTKDEARDYGWQSGSLELIFPGMRIGGDRFGNYEGLLPEAPGRTYWECDIVAAEESSRGARRIVFSNDGLIFYTDDHYESFTQLYGDDAR